MVSRETPMAEIEWKPLPTPMWPEGSVMADWSGLLLEASFEQGVPTWKVQRSMGKNALPTLVASGTADSFEAAKAAALHMAEAAVTIFIPGVARLATNTLARGSVTRRAETLFAARGGHLRRSGSRPERARPATDPAVSDKIGKFGALRR